MSLPIAVLISGGGSNLQSILDDAAQQNHGFYHVCCVISNEPNARGIERARRAGVPVQVLDHRAFKERRLYDEALAAKIDAYQPGLVVLAGFMRILGPDFVEPYQGRLLNIHPSLLPAFPGLNTHKRALDSGAVEHGASVHFVTSQLDAGPIIIQARVPVFPDDTPESLADRVLREEHKIYPKAIRWFAQHRLELTGGQARLDGELCPILVSPPP